MKVLSNYFMDGNQSAFGNVAGNMRLVSNHSLATQNAPAYNHLPATAVAGPSTQIAINNNDINNINTMVSLSNDTEEDAESDDEETIDADQVVRQSITSLRYQVWIAGRTLYPTAIQLERRFMGVKSAIWGFWKNQKRVSKHEVRELLIHNGVDGLYEEIIWQFLDDDEHSELIMQRKGSTLSGFTFKNC